jgi:hypothetical protein
MRKKVLAHLALGERILLFVFSSPKCRKNFSLVKRFVVIKDAAVANTTSIAMSVTNPLDCSMSSSATPYYNCPFLLETSSSEHSITDMAEKCAHIPFNMALAYLQEGVRTKKSKRTLKALLIYQKVRLALGGVQFKGVRRSSSFFWPSLTTWRTFKWRPLMLMVYDAAAVCFSVPCSTRTAPN